MRTKSFNVKKLLSLILAIAVMAAMALPTNVFAADNGTISTDLDKKTIVIGETVEFTVSSTKNEVGGTVMVKGKFEVEAEPSDLTLEYMESTDGNWYPFPISSNEGVLSGEFGPVETGFPLMDATSTFRVTFSKAGTYSVKVSAVKVEDGSEMCSENVDVIVLGYADYAEARAAIDAANGYVADKYTAASYDKLTDAVKAAEDAIAENWTSDKQSQVTSLVKAINDAIEGLVETKEVRFTAVAVADNASADYAKANKIVLVFDEPVADSANAMLSKLSIADKVASAVWTTNTVYTMTLEKEHGLLNNAEVAFNSDETILTALGYAMTDTKTNVVGNLEEAYEEITATDMAAAIVNKDDQPEMVDGDKIVLVFNAPVYGNPETITVSDMTATVVADTYNTVYEIVLDAEDNASVKAGQTLTFKDAMNTEIKATLTGSFGRVIVPVVVRALISDEDGTAKTEGDKIYVFFDTPTDKAAGAEETDFTGVLAGATGKWGDNQTLIITLGNTAITANDKIDITSLNIKDFYGKEAIAGADIALEGSFGTAVQPALLTLTAISKQGKGAPSAGDEIYLAFNVKMREDALNLKNDFDFSYGDYGTGASVAWATGAEYAEYSTIIITLGEGANVVPGETKITIEKELFEESGTKSCEVSNLENRIVTGTFGTSIAPSLISASIVKRSTEVGSQPGDQIVLLFNVPTNAADIINLISVAGGDLGNNVEEGTWSNNNTIYTITLGDGASIENDTSITFTNTNGVLKDINNQKVASTKTLDLNGSFGAEAEEVGISPSSVTATIVKTTAAAGAQAGDQIVFAFNVATNGADLKNYFVSKGIYGSTGLDGGWSNGNTIYTLVLGEGATVTDSNVVEFSVEAGIKDKNEINNAVTLTAGAFIGSFGSTITPSGVVPEVTSATIVKNDAGIGAEAGDRIVITFNMATNKASLFDKLGGAAVFGTGAKGEWNDIGNIYTITLGENATVSENTVLKITAEAGLKDKNEYSECVVNDNIELTGSFGEAIDLQVLGAVAYSAKDGDDMSDYVDIEFNVDITETVAKTIFGTSTEMLFGSSYELWRNETSHNILTIKLGDDYTVKNGSVIEFSTQNEHKLTSENGKKLDGAATVTVKGELRKPMVKKIVAVNEGTNGKIRIVFSSKTNEKKDIDLTSQSSSLGVGATSTWLNNYTLEITLGANRTISVGGGYIVLNGLGITNGFDEDEVVGQYFISEGELPEDELKAVDARVNERTDGSYLTIIFNKPTDMNANIANVVCSKFLGADAAMTWETATKLVIKLGADTELKDGKNLAEGANVSFTKLKFANGLGTVDSNPIAITGSFDGRETKLDDLTAKVEGDYTVATVTMNKQELEYTDAAIVTFVIWDKDNKLVTDMNAMKIDMEAVQQIEVSSKFATKEAGKVDIYVTDTYIDTISADAPAFNLLADTATSSVTATVEGSEN